MIKKIIKALQNNTMVSDWLLVETTNKSNESFYVRSELETTRITNIHEYNVIVYKTFFDGDKEYFGHSRFVVSHDISSKQLNELIEQALMSASLVKSEPYKLVKGDKKRTWKGLVQTQSPMEINDQIADLFNSATTLNARFNALEIFNTTKIIHVVNSRGVNLQKVLNNVFVEAIPSYDGIDQKVELYKSYNYQNVNFDLIKQDAINAIKEVEYRYNAKAINEKQKIDVLIQNDEVAQFFHEIIGAFSYDSIYRNMTAKRIGDKIQMDPRGDLINLSLIPNSKYDTFDSDGVILKKTEVLKAGQIYQYYGSNRFAQYLNIEPTGDMNMVNVVKGRKTIDELKKRPHIEILALSGIQIDIECGYIGGEVRLALYNDGVNEYPISGFSFSGNLNECLNNLQLSKETITLKNYLGPQMVLLKGMEII